MERIKYLIEPVNKSSWNGIDRYVDSLVGIRAAVTTGGKTITGLTTSPLKVKDKVSGNQVVYNGTQDLLERELGLEKGTLRISSDISPNKFWLDYVVMLESGVTEINAEDPEEYLKLLFLSAQPQVEVGRDNIKSKTEWVIVSPEAEATADSSRREKYHAAIVALSKATAEQKRAAMYVLGVNPKDKSDNIIFNLLDDFALNKPEQITKLLSDPTLVNKAFINKCVFNRLLTRRGSLYYHGENLIGSDISEAVEHLFADGNKELLVSLKESM